MIKVRQLDPKTLTKEDLDLLELGCRGSYDKATAKDQLKAINQGSAWIFKILGDADGIFVLSRGNVEDREIVMTALAGKKIIKHFPECYRAVKELCHSVGAKRLIGYVSRPGLKLIYENYTKALPVATLFSEDLNV